MPHFLINIAWGNHAVREKQIKCSAVITEGFVIGSISTHQPIYTMKRLYMFANKEQIHNRQFGTIN